MRGWHNPENLIFSIPMNSGMTEMTERYGIIAGTDGLWLSVIMLR